MTSLKARLAKAKSRLFGTAAREVAVPFELPCDCGHRVTGIRRPTYQLATCSACQATVFVLPVNVYPANRQIRSEVIDGPVMNRVGTVLRDLVLGDPVGHSDAKLDEKRDRPPKRARSAASPVADQAETEERQEERRRGQKRRRGDGSQSDVAAKNSAVEDASPAEPRVALPRVSASVRLRRLFTVTRLMALAGFSLLLVTGWWTMRQRTLDNARKVWRAEMDRVDEAMDRRDLATLGETLARAVEAAQTLNRNDAEAREAEFLLRQTEAVQVVSATDLVSLFSEMIDANRVFNTNKAASAAASLAGQKLVFEAALKKSANEQAAATLDFPLIIDTIPVEIRVSSKLLTACAERNPTAPLLFIAAIQQCQPPSQLDRIWQITLDGASCTLITTELHAAELGYDLSATPAVEQTIRGQAEFVRTLGKLPEQEVAITAGGLKK